MDELLALLGQHWRLLLLYPGGLSALGATALVRLSFGRPALRLDLGSLPVAALWLLAGALLPLPQTRWPYALDLATLLLVVELPFWLWLLRRSQPASIDCAAALLGCYPLLALAIAAVGQGAGTLVVLDINRSGGPLHWAGLAAWSLVLPPLLGLGPWQTHGLRGALPTLRQTLHIALLAAAAVPANDPTSRWAALLAFAAILAPLAALQRWWCGDPARWMLWQPWLVVGFGTLLAALAAQTLLGRVR